MDAEEQIVTLVAFLSEHFWRGHLPRPERDAETIAAILNCLAPQDTPADVWNRTAFFLAQAFDLLRRQRAQVWVN